MFRRFDKMAWFPKWLAHCADRTQAQAQTYQDHGMHYEAAIAAERADAFRLVREVYLDRR